MAIASRLGPWLLGTVKETTGSVAGTIRNMGVSPVSQFKTVAYAETTAQTLLAVIPAGSAIQQIQFLTTTAYTTTAPTFTIFVNGTAISAAVSTGTAGATGVAPIALGTTNPALVGNVGTGDAVISFTQANGGGGTGAGVLNIVYFVRNPDGTYGPNA